MLEVLGVLMSGQLGMDSIIVKRVVESQADWNLRWDTFKRVKVKKICFEVCRKLIIKIKKNTISKNV